MMRLLFTLLLLASCRQAPSTAVVEASPWPPSLEVAESLPDAVSPADAVTMADLASAVTQ